MKKLANSWWVILLWVGISIGATFPVSYGLGLDAEDIGMRAKASKLDGYLLEKSQRRLVFVLAGILCSLTAASFWFSTRVADKSKSSSVENLFLGFKFGEAQTSEEPCLESGFLRSLGPSQASFVANKGYSRQSHLKICLSTLPGYPKNDKFVEGEVLSCRSMGGDPQSYMINVRFPNISSASRDELTQYIQYLVSPAHAGIGGVNHHLPGSSI